MARKVTKLPKELTYPRQGKFLISLFLPALGISKKIEDKAVRKVARKIARRKLGNAVRFFSAGGWEPFTQPNLHQPYVKKYGKFDLEVPNDDHIQTLKRRVEYFTDRRITVILTLIDNCSTHVNRPGFWNRHWMNGDNNVNDTRAEKQSLYHWYENTHKPDPQGRQAKNTGKFLEKYIRYIVSELGPNPYIVYEICNEGAAGVGWHGIYANILNDCGVNKKHRITSLYWRGFYLKPIDQFCNYCKHSVSNIEEFNFNKQFFKPGVKWLPSGDGRNLPDKSVLFKLVTKILQDGHKGYELNTHGMFNDLPWGHMKAMRRAWFKWMKIPLSEFTQ